MTTRTGLQWSLLRTILLRNSCYVCQAVLASLQSWSFQLSNPASSIQTLNQGGDNRRRLIVNFNFQGFLDGVPLDGCQPLNEEFCQLGSHLGHWCERRELCRADQTGRRVRCRNQAESMHRCSGRGANKPRGDEPAGSQCWAGEGWSNQSSTKTMKCSWREAEGARYPAVTGKVETKALTGRSRKQVTEATMATSGMKWWSSTGGSVWWSMCGLVEKLVTGGSRRLRTWLMMGRCDSLILFCLISI